MAAVARTGQGSAGPAAPSGPSPWRPAAASRGAEGPRSREMAAAGPGRAGRRRAFEGGGGGKGLCWRWNRAGECARLVLWSHGTPELLLGAQCGARPRGASLWPQRRLAVPGAVPGWPLPRTVPFQAGGA